jgi:hypothetical protein
MCENHGRSPVVQPADDNRLAYPAIGGRGFFLRVIIFLLVLVSFSSASIG